MFNKIFKKVGMARRKSYESRSRREGLKMIGLVIFAMAAMWAVMPAGGAENTLSVAISLVVVFVALDKAVDFDILDIQSKLLTPPALTLL